MCVCVYIYTHTHTHTHTYCNTYLRIKTGVFTQCDLSQTLSHIQNMLMFLPMCSFISIYLLSVS